MFQGDIGDKSTCTQVVPLVIPAGATITVKNLTGGSTVEYYTHHAAGKNGTTSSGSYGTITAGASQTFSTSPAWISSLGRSSVQITGAGY